MSEARRLRLEALYDERPPATPPHTQLVSTLVIRTMEKDVRTLIAAIERQYVDPDLAMVIRRLRKWVD